MAGFYAARDNTMPPLPWPSIAPPFTALNLQRFERDMLNICAGNSMDRVVRALDYGEFEVVHNGVREWVFFIVFEKASGDIRTKARDYRGNGVAWIPRVVHNLGRRAERNGIPS